AVIFPEGPAAVPGETEGTADDPVTRDAQRQLPTVTQVNEALELFDPVVVLSAVQVVVVHPRGVGASEATRDEVVAATEEAAALKDGVDERGRDPEVVDEECRDSRCDRLDRRCGAHRDEGARPCKV